MVSLFAVIPAMIVTTTTLQLNSVNCSTAEVKMTSRGQMLFVSSGNSVKVDCDFYADGFNLFDNPVVWKKFQREEESQINVMSNIIEPFLLTNRLTVSLYSHPPLYQLSLQLNNISLEDSGNYTCEIRGRKSVVLSYVTHHVFVLETVTSPESCDQSNGQLIVIDDKAVSLECQVIGGYPPPAVSVYIGGDDVTQQFLMTSQESVLEGSRGLRQMIFNTRMSTDSLIFHSDDDGAVLKCVVGVPGLPTTYSEATVRVLYEPVVNCQRTHAELFSRNVYVTCLIKSNPTPTVLHWIIDDVINTTVSVGQVIGDYWTLVLDRQDGMLETRLYVREVTSKTFRKYCVVAGNTVGSRSRCAQFNHKQRISSYSDITHQFVVSADDAIRQSPFPPVVVRLQDNSDQSADEITHTAVNSTTSAAATSINATSKAIKSMTPFFTNVLYYCNTSIFVFCSINVINSPLGI